MYTKLLTIFIKKLGNILAVILVKEMYSKGIFTEQRFIYESIN